MVRSGPALLPYESSSRSRRFVDPLCEAVAAARTPAVPRPVPERSEAEFGRPLEQVSRNQTGSADHRTEAFKILARILARHISGTRSEEREQGGSTKKGGSQ